MSMHPTSLNMPICASSSSSDTSMCSDATSTIVSGNNSHCQTLLSSFSGTTHDPYKMAIQGNSNLTFGLSVSPSGNNLASFTSQISQQLGLPENVILQIGYLLPGETLIQSGNQAYIGLSQQHQQLRFQLEASNRERDAYQCEINGMKSLYDKLLHRLDTTLVTPSLGACIPASTASASPIPPFPSHTPLQEKDYTGVRFWHKATFSGARKSSNLTATTKFGTSSTTSREPLSSTAYLEDKEGNPLTKDQIASMNSLARAVWNYFWDNNCSPTNYTTANDLHIGYFRHRLGQLFPELYLGEGYWKFQQLWSTNYSSWRSTKDGKDTRIKVEGTGNEDTIKASTVDPTEEKDTPVMVSKQQDGKRKRLSPLPSLPHLAPIKKKAKHQPEEKVKRGDPLMGVRVMPKPRPILRSSMVANVASTITTLFTSQELGLAEEATPVEKCLSPSEADATRSGDQTPVIEHDMISVNEDVSSSQAVSMESEDLALVVEEEVMPVSEDPKTVLSPKAHLLKPVTKLASASDSTVVIAPKEPLTGVIHIPGQTTVKKIRHTRVKRFIPGTAHTPKNLCAREWIKEHPGGSKEDFDKFFSLQTVATLNEFKKQSTYLKKNK